MRPVMHSLVAGMVALGMVLCMQGCGKDSRLKWIEKRIESGGGSGAIDRIREQFLKSGGGGGGDRGPELSVLNPHCYPHEFLGRGELPLFLTLPLLDLIDKFTQDELEDMILVIEREMPVVENGSQKTKVKLNYLLPLKLYFMVQDVVGPDQMASEEVKKIFYMFGIPFLPETYAELTSQSRVVSLKPDAYAQSWAIARRYFEHLSQWDLHQRVMNEILPQGELVSWLETRGFLRDEIDYLLKHLWLEDAPPESWEHTTVYVSIDQCSSTLEVPWFASLPGSKVVSADKKPDEIRDLYFELTLFFPIFITGYFCPSPTPSPTPATPVHDWVQRPSPSPKYVDQVKLVVGDKLIPGGGGEPYITKVGDKFTTPGGKTTVTLRTGGEVPITDGTTVTPRDGRTPFTVTDGTTVTTSDGDVVTFGDGDQVTGDRVTTGGAVDQGGQTTQTDQVTQAAAVLTYGGCSCSTTRSFPAEGSRPAFKVCLQAPPNDKGWNGNSNADTSAWLVHAQYNGAVTLNYNETKNRVYLLKCCSKQAYAYPEGVMHYDAIHIAYSGTGNTADIFHPYTPTAQYQMCNDSDHVFAFPGGTGTPHGVLTDPNRAVSSLPAQTWYDFVTAHPINPTQCP